MNKGFDKLIFKVTNLTILKLNNTCINKEKTAIEKVILKKSLKI